MNLFKLANVIEKKISVLQIEPNLCTRLISPKSTCQHCVDSCPVKCISITKNAVDISDKCIECGLCTTVCPTSTLSSQRPSLNQFVEDTLHTCKENERVYLHCQKQAFFEKEAASVSVPCLGIIPREAWLSIISECDNLAIYQSNNGCNGCEIAKGEEVCRGELAAGERMSGSHLVITANVERSKQPGQLDQSKRTFFYSIFSEWKAANKMTVKEMLGSSEVEKFQDKLQDDSVSKVKKEWKVVSNHIIEKITNESMYPYQNKRNLLLKKVVKSKSLQKQKDVRLPEILPDCTMCGACTVLCPTNALAKETKNGISRITLTPSNCVDCRLCEEICYFEQIRLVDVMNQELLSEQKVLASCSEM